MSGWMRSARQQTVKWRLDASGVLEEHRGDLVPGLQLLEALLEPRLSLVSFEDPLMSTSISQVMRPPMHDASARELTFLVHPPARHSTNSVMTCSRGTISCSRRPFSSLRRYTYSSRSGTCQSGRSGNL